MPAQGNPDDDRPGPGGQDPERPAARLVYLHARADQELCEELERHLSVLERAGLIQGWRVAHLQPGGNIQIELTRRLAEADVLILLMSADLFAQEYGLVERALRRKDDAGTCLLPVIVRPVDLRGTPLDGLKVLPANGVPVSLWTHREQAWLEVVQTVRSHVEGVPDPPPIAGDNPYRGLSAFQQEDARFFFGREELTLQLWQAFSRLHEQAGAVRLFGILGPSGSGKSSVARAGLIPMLLEHPLRGWRRPRIATVTPGERPIERLARELVPLRQPPGAGPPSTREVQELEEQVLRRQSASGAYEGLRRFARDLPGVEEAPLVLLVDQFEEVYAQRTTQKDREIFEKDRDLFVGLLLHAAADPERAVSVVITLRGDFFEETRRHPELNRAIASPGAHALVPMMGPDELRRAIALPASQKGHPLDDTTLELLLKQAEDRQGALPLLEFALTRIWDGLREGKKPARTLDEIGGVGGALAGAAQSIYDELTDGEKRIARRAFLQMVRLGEGVKDTRRRARVLDLVAGAETPRQVREVLRRFAGPGARLVTLDVDDQEREVAEVTHEALFYHWHQLRTWIDQGREDIRFRRRLTAAIHHWESGSPRDDGALWRGRDLDLLREFRRRSTADMTRTDEAFLGACERAEARRRRRQLGVVVAVTGLMVFLALSGYEWWSKDKLRRQTDEDIRAKDALAQARRPREVITALSTAIDLWGRSRDRGQPPSPQIIEALTTALTTPGPALPPLRHEGRVWALAFSRDGRWLATAGADHAAHVWDVATGGLHRALVGHAGEVTAIAFTPSGERIVTAGADGTARLWDTATGEAVFTFRGHAGEVLALTVSQDGRVLATAGADGTVRLWALEPPGEAAAAVLRGHTGSVNAVDLSPDGALVASAGEDGTVRLWDARRGAPARPPVLSGRGAGLTMVLFSPDGLSLLAIGYDPIGRLWDARSGTLRAELRGHEHRLYWAAFSPDATMMVTGSEDGTARLWNLDGSTAAILKGHTGWIYSVAFSPDGTMVATGATDHTVRLWDGHTGALLAVMRGHKETILSLGFSWDSRLLASGGLDAVQLWQTRPAEMLPDLWRSRLFAAVASPTGTAVATAHEDGGVRIWDAGAEALSLRTTLSGHQGAVRALAFSPDAALLASGGADGTIWIWNVATGVPLRVLHGHRKMVTAVAFSPDGRRLLSGSWDQTARVWGLLGSPLRTLPGPPAAVLGVAVSPEGRDALIATGDGRAYAWELETGRHRLTLPGHQDAVRQASYSPDGSRIVTTGMDDVARLWDAHSGGCLAILGGHRDDVLSAAFAPDGALIATGDNEGAARLWDGRTGAVRGAFPGHPAGVVAVIFDGPHRRLLSFDADGGVLSSPTDPAALLARACERVRPWPAWAAVAGRCAAVPSINIPSG